MEHRNLTIPLHIKINVKTKKIIDKLERRLNVSRAEVVRRAIEFFESKMETK